MQKQSSINAEFEGQVSTELSYLEKHIEGAQTVLATLEKRLSSVLRTVAAGEAQQGPIEAVADVRVPLAQRIQNIVGSVLELSEALNGINRRLEL